MNVEASPRIDGDIRAAVTAELEWTPDIDAAGIGVTVEDGVVSLLGEVADYAERASANRAALRVRDVTAVVNELSIQQNSTPMSENDIGKEVEHALRSTINVPDTVKAEIDGHAVTLTGQVEWDFQRRAAARSVQYLRGVHSIDNRLNLTSRAAAADTADRVRNTIVRNSLLGVEAVTVDAEGDKVTLTGTVRSWAARRQADLAAWSSPHVTEVYNHILAKSP
ncbi:BON domain-containing protein [Mycolicibacterium hodleri]|uniref:BON domain-containing protein n=1 Tax=Mycolicibacterium hodleri TaxID=49897 RepID=A0A502E7N9_9MYCO|nr:BON domain-containing protein [Mycolicibacterium hodleri]TPG32872.1 BON domain-containing protein [Mycolicibacterium hodleri]